ncbi:uncharacterized protein BO66DRAFT_438444 [Aspergillus aculeatinus CBS 121060]|uniref:Uncharacterized protein n=1 Tax=Aspergillus aculeatinus CBS 121060 TaxID=1448322 RepID=A0ACD1H986_9EURO|nr:hypothetical protein BO66DRAFT_438444 [Aspergillus aculeatinus CBS 121060]RAH70083.1 hypothetical protein BO66DRAFT_438444 [Aspergillus aculeatinus CBS 121060]
MDPLTLQERVSTIAQTTTDLVDKLRQVGDPEPSFEHGLPPSLQTNACAGGSTAAAALRLRLLQQVDELRAVLTEPALLLTPEMQNPSLSGHAIVRLGIAESFPPEGTTVTALAQKLRLREDLVRRLLAHSATYHVYYESEPDRFVHTAASRLLAENPGMRDWIRLGCEELLPATMQIANAILRYPSSEEPKHCGWNIQNQTSEPIFRALAGMPDRASLFARAMSWHAREPGFSPRYLAEAFPWQSTSTLLDPAREQSAVGSPDDACDPTSPHSKPFTIVDMGGGLGHISQALLAHHLRLSEAEGHDHGTQQSCPSQHEHDNNQGEYSARRPRRRSVQCIVQDAAQVVSQAISTAQAQPATDASRTVEPRIEFQAHDFFHEQPVKGADVYLLRLVLHDWSDKYALQILRALIPALQPGAKVVVNDRVVPGRHEVHYLVEREARDYDMYMMAFQNAKERTLEDWTALFGAADARFGWPAVHRPVGSGLAVLEFTWEG